MTGLNATLERQKEKREISAEEWAHNAQMEKYREILFSGADPEEKTQREPEAVARKAAAWENIPSAAERIAAYRPYTAPASKKILFEGISYNKESGEIVNRNGGELVLDAPAPQTATAPVSAPQAAPAEQPRETTEEDALPTRRTMDTLNRAEAHTAVAQKGGLLAAWASVSPKTKAVLIAAAVAVVLAIVLVCINTAILNSLNASVAVKEIELTELTETYNGILEEINAVTDPDYVGQWAAENGWILQTAV